MPKVRLSGPVLARSGLVLAALVYIAAFVVQAKKNPLRGDEVDYFACIENLRENGRILYYAGEVDYPESELVQRGTDQLGSRAVAVREFLPERNVQKGNRFLLEGTSRYTYCLWHPPLYIESVALATRVFPVSRADAWQLRLLHLPFVALLIAALAALSRRVYPERHALVTSIALLALAFNTLWLRGSSLIDYNGTLAPAVAALGAGAYLRTRERWSATAVVCFALGWATSFGIGTALTFAMLVCAALTHDLRLLLRVAASLALGFALFSAVFYGWAAFRHFSFAEPYVYNFLATGGNSNAFHLGRSLRFFGRVALALGVVPMLLFFALLARPARRAQLFRGAPAVLVLTVLAGLAIPTLLRAEAYGFPKYVVFVVPLLLLVVAGELVTWLGEPRPLVPRLARAALLLLGVESSVRFALSVADPNPNLYLAGQLGFARAVVEVEQRSRPEAVVIAPKDVAFYAGRKFIEPFAIAKLSPALLRRTLARHEIPLASYQTEILQGRDPDADALLRARFPVVQPSEGAFRLLLAKPAR